MPEIGSHESPSGRELAGGGARIAWKDEIRAGVLGALLLFSIAVPVGALAFAPLGPGYTGFGVVAGLIGGIAGGIVAALLSGDPLLRTGPMTAAALVLGSVLASLLAIPAWQAAGPAGITLAISAALAAMVLGGILQIVLGVSRLSGIANFTPRPVLGGFRNGVALLILLGQVPVLLGVPGSLLAHDLQALRDAWLPWNALAGVIGVVAIVLARVLGAIAVAPLAGLLAATGAHYLLRYAGVEHPGPVIGPLPPIPEVAGVWHWTLPRFTGDAAWPVLPLVSGAVSVALVGAVLTLLAARALEDSPFVRIDSDRLLRAQGAANVATALLGGAPVAGSIAQSQAQRQAGSRGRTAGILASLTLGVAAVTLGDAIASIPLVALACVMLVIGWDTLDRETPTLVRDLLRRGTYRRSRAQDLLVVLAVTAASVLFDVVVGVLAGIVLAAILFVIANSATIVRRHTTGAFRRSGHKRSEFESRRLDHAGARTAIFELQGGLFFGNADVLAEQVMLEAPGVRYAIFDFARVQTVDATGIHLLRQLREYLRNGGGELLLSGCRERSQVRGVLLPPGDDDPFPSFPDVDRALEWCENASLAELTLDTTFRDELPFERMELCLRLDARQVAALRARALRSECPAGTRLFTQGMRGDEIFLLAHGRVSVLLDRDEGRSGRRLATYGPGMVFGEMAVLESRVRTASSRCDTDVVVWRIARSTLRTLVREDPALGAAVYKALARILSGRLREATRELRDTSEP